MTLIIDKINESFDCNYRQQAILNVISGKVPDSSPDQESGGTDGEVTDEEIEKISPQNRSPFLNELQFALWVQFEFIDFAKVVEKNLGPILILHTHGQKLV